MTLQDDDRQTTATITSAPDDRCFHPGDRVTIFRLAIARRPFIEGVATVHDCIDASAGYYRVAFERDGGRLRDRLIFPGVWQSDPHAQLQRMLTAWRASIDPDLLADLDF